MVGDTTVTSGMPRIGESLLDRKSVWFAAMAKVELSPYIFKGDQRRAAERVDGFQVCSMLRSHSIVKKHSH